MLCAKKLQFCSKSGAKKETTEKVDKDYCKGRQ